jgi:hypothetical protein
MLVFIDESGHPRPTDNTKRPVLLATCIKETDAGRLARAMFAKRKALLAGFKLTAAEREGKAVQFLNRRSLSKGVAKREFAESLFDYLREFDLAVFAIVMERPEKLPFEGPDVFQTQYRWLFERIENYMEDQHPDYMAIPVFDDLDPAQNRKLSDRFTRFMVRSDAGKAMRQIVPTPLFVDSSMTPGIQIADWFAYVIRIHEEEELYKRTTISDPYFATIKRFAKIVQAKTVNVDEGEFTRYGICTMGAEKFIYEAPSASDSEERG